MTFVYPRNYPQKYKVTIKFGKKNSKIQQILQNTCPCDLLTLSYFFQFEAGFDLGHCVFQNRDLGINRAVFRRFGRNYQDKQRNRNKNKAGEILNQVRGNITESWNELSEKMLLQLNQFYGNIIDFGNNVISGRSFKTNQENNQKIPFPSEIWTDCSAQIQPPEINIYPIITTILFFIFTYWLFYGLVKETDFEWHEKQKYSRLSAMNSCFDPVNLPSKAKFRR